MYLSTAEKNCLHVLLIGQSILSIYTTCIVWGDILEKYVMYGLNYSQGLSGVAVRHQWHIVSSYYRADFVVKQKRPSHTEWVGLNKEHWPLRLARRQEQGNKDRGMPQVTCLRFIEKAVKMTHNWGLELHDDAKVSAEAFSHYQVAAWKAGPRLKWDCVSADKHNCVGFLPRTVTASICLYAGSTVLALHRVWSHILWITWKWHVYPLPTSVLFPFLFESFVWAELAFFCIAELTYSHNFDMCVVSR